MGGQLQGGPDLLDFWLWGFPQTLDSPNPHPRCPLAGTLSCCSGFSLSQREIRTVVGMRFSSENSNSRSKCSVVVPAWLPVQSASCCVTLARGGTARSPLLPSLPASGGYQKGLDRLCNRQD
jgi:hypothetical protein